MKDFILTKIPESVTHAFIDSDTIAYEASFAVEKSRYQYTNTVTGEKSVLFADAKTGKRWLVTQAEESELFGFHFDAGEWERETVKVTGTEAEALEATDATIKGWLKHVPKGVTWKGYLTEKGVQKTKDIEGLEKRYQGNRANVKSPTHLVTCRNHLMSKEEFSMVKGGFEADAIVIAMSEKKGVNGMLMSLDKDLRQAEKTYIVDRSYEPPMILFTADGVGGVWECPIKSKPAKKQWKYTGCGFKWLCYQAVAGDAADGYGGIKGVGARAVIEALDDCNTHAECLESIYNTFYKIKEKWEYKSWDGQDISLTPAQMMHQHFSLPYMERSPKDTFSFEKYNWQPSE